MFKRIIAVAMGLGLQFTTSAQTLPAAALAKLPEIARRALAQARFEQHAALLYGQMALGVTGLAYPVFREGLLGYYNVRRANGSSHARQVLTVVDFGRSSQQKRLWVLDLANSRVLFHTLVAHGKASGGDLPVTFSNHEGSEMSSLGFYRTAPSTYIGKHGLSLKLRGLDAGFNDHAEQRAVVMHGADYVSEDFVRAHGRLGRSQGCPALPVALAKPIVQAIRGGSVLYLHGPAGATYRSRWLDVDTAISGLAAPAGGEVGN